MNNSVNATQPKYTGLIISLLAIAIVTVLFGRQASANDKIKQAIRKYEQRIEEERAKVIATFERESRLAERRNNSAGSDWIEAAKLAWMNKEMVVSERGGLRFFTGASETFKTDDFNLSGDFKKNENALFAHNGNATARLGKPARAVYFRGIVESKNNFVVQLNSSGLDQAQDLAIIVGGWNNTRSEMRLDNRTVATKPVGMPRRWLCEVCYDKQVVTIFANGVCLMTAQLDRPLEINVVNVSVSYDSATTLHSPVLKVK